MTTHDIYAQTFHYLIHLKRKLETTALTAPKANSDPHETPRVITVGDIQPGLASNCFSKQRTDSLQGLPSSCLSRQVVDLSRSGRVEYVSTSMQTEVGQDFSLVNYQVHSGTTLHSK